VRTSELAAPRAEIDVAALRATLRGQFTDVDAVAHRIVHGGERFRDAVTVDAGVRRQLEELADLAPLHQPKSLAALDAVCAELPDIQAIACFDTAFHATLAPAAATYALPAPWRERWGIRRYGFHGLSHAWIARRAPQVVKRRRRRPPRIVSCHLGAGASLCAIAERQSVDTTMGFTPLAGLVMATRSGDVDPGLLLWLLERKHMAPEELADALEHRAGLLGLVGTADMRAIVERADARDGAAQLALDVYTHRLRGGIASMAAAMGGIDVLAFTGGVGENSPRVRAEAAAGLGFLGAELDEESNRAARADADITAPRAHVSTVVVSAREDLEIAAQARRLLAAG